MTLIYKMAGTRKISDNEFWAVLRENSGLFSKTARAIEKQFGVRYTRQAVYARAMKNKELYEDIKEQNIDVAEDGLHSLMHSEDERVKMQAVKFFLSTQGKNRNYTEKQEIDHTSGGEPLGFVLLPKRELHEHQMETDTETS